MYPDQDEPNCPGQEVQDGEQSVLLDRRLSVARLLQSRQGGVSQETLHEVLVNLRQLRYLDEFDRMATSLQNRQRLVQYPLMRWRADILPPNIFLEADRQLSLLLEHRVIERQLLAVDIVFFGMDVGVVMLWVVDELGEEDQVVH